MKKFRKWQAKCEATIQCDGNGPWENCDEENKIGTTVCEYGIENPDAGAWRQRCIMDEEKSKGFAETITCDWNRHTSTIRSKHERNNCELKCFTSEMEQNCTTLEAELANWSKFATKS